MKLRPTHIRHRCRPSATASPCPWRSRCRQCWPLPVQEAVARPGSTGSGSSTDTLTWALPASPTSLDMFSDFSTTSDTVIELISDGLVTLHDLKLEPDLATSWKAISPSTYVYTIRKGVPAGPRTACMRRPRLPRCRAQILLVHFMNYICYSRFMPG